MRRTRFVLQFLHQRKFHQSSFMRQDDDRFQKLSRHSFWKNRYANNSETFDWFLTPRETSEYVLEKVNKHFCELTRNPVRILDIGCGTSGLPPSIISQSIHPVEYHCLDYIPEAVEFQRQQCSSCSKGNGQSSCLPVVGNVLDLPYPSSFFHVIVDKGTMDALLKDRNRGRAWSRQMALECHRVLTTRGHFLQVSDEDPDSRCPLLESLFPAQGTSTAIRFTVHTSDNGLEYFTYEYSKS